MSMLNILNSLPPTIYNLCARYKKSPGAYILQFQDGSVYFGASKQVGCRLRQHLNTDYDPPITKARILAIGAVDYVFELEKRLIRRFAASSRLRNDKCYPLPPHSHPRPQSIRQQALAAGMDPSAVYWRLRAGESLEEALRPRNRRVKQWVEFEGKKYGLKELASMYNMGYQTLDYRLKKGIPVAAALKKPHLHPGGGLQPHAKTVRRHGITYPSIAAAARALGIRVDSVRQQIQRGTTIVVR